MSLDPIELGDATAPAGADLRLHRRRFLSIATAWIVGLPPAMGAGPNAGARIAKVGVLEYDPEAHAHLWSAFSDELKRLGRVEGRDIVFERRAVRGSSPESGLERGAKELVDAKVDVIFTCWGTISALAAKRATSTIPIVFSTSADPVGTGLVASLSHPGGNATGSATATAETASKSLELLVELLGRRNLRVVQVQSRRWRSEPWFPGVERAIANASRSLGMRYEYVEADSRAEFESVLMRLARERVDAITIQGVLIDERDLVRITTDTLVASRIPSFGMYEGSIFNYEPDFGVTSRIAARNVDLILRGTPPSRIPVELPKEILLTVDLRAARAIGLTVPDSVLLRAAEVVR